MAAAAVDVGYLAASYAVPETTFQSLLSDPTVELVQSLLTQIEAKAREFDDLKAEKLRSEVELEAAVHSADARARTLKFTAEKAQKDVEELRQQLAQEQNARQQIETELQNLQTSATSSSSEVQALESRIKSLEAQNRDTLALHEAKSAAHDRLAEELSAQHQKFVNLRKQVAELEEKNQSLENAATSVKFRESNFQQEIELLRKNNEWFESELKTRSADNTKFRKEKNAQIAELQRANADATQTIETLRRTETSQRQRLEDLEQKVEQSLARIQQLQEEAAQNEQSFRAELDNARRLAALHQESANTVKARLKEVQEQLTQTSDSAALEVGQLQAEVESEQIRASQFEGRVAELESIVENLESQVSELRTSAQAIPSTPRRGMNGSFETPGRAGSPAVFSPGGSRLKGGMSVTQLYTENAQLKTELRAHQEREEKRTATLNEMLEELESRQPEIEELRQENERLTSETGEISALLEEAIAEKETARKEARKAQGDYQGLLHETDLLRQQLQDCTTQMRLLLLRQQAQEQGLEVLTPEQQQYLRDTVENKIPQNQLDDKTATGQLISQHLLLFKNISELQAQNAELVRTVREVADTYEGMEAQTKAKQHEKDLEELAKLREKLAQYEDEIKSLNLRSQSFMKERDMYRRIVTSRGQLPPGVEGFDQSISSRSMATPPPGNAPPSVEQTPHSKEIAGYEKLIKDLQAHMDLLKEESATDRISLKQQVDRLTKETNDLQTERIRLSSKVQKAEDSCQFLQEKISHLQSEKTELQKRWESLQDLFAKQDIRTQQAAEDLVEAKSQLDSVQRENTQLKSAQTMWKTIEARLTESNKELVEERGRLTRMVTDIQNLRNEQELAEAENRRRVQDRANSLEAELQIAKRKLEEEVEDHKKAMLRREYEQTETRRRIDDLMKASTDARLELASIKSTRDQLQERINELQAQLRSAEERAHLLQPRPTPRVNGSSEGEDDAAAREEELTEQIAEIQRKFERKQEELEAANTQIETYKNIAQEAEEQLQSYVEAHEHLQEEMNRVGEQKDATINDLRQRVEEISSELATTNTELTELRGKHEQEQLRLNQQKELLEAEVARLQEDANEYKAEMESQSQLVASQAEIATRAQQDYENELAKHGETMRNLRSLREEHNQLRTEITEFRTQAEAARTSLAQGEEHWASIKERYEGELTEARNRYTDLNEHNKKLLEQFDGFKGQITSLKSSRASLGASGVEPTETGSNGLQDIVTYLRQEKDILEVQLNMKEQEVKRLEQTLNHTQSQLDQTRDKLLAEQSHAQNSQSGSSLQTLQESIEQLNVYRESTTTLRNELRRTETQLAQKSKEVEDLHNQLQPLQARVSELEGELELSAGHLKTVEEDRERWQKRHQDVLQRYDRIDPKELEDLKKQIEDLQTERDQALEQVSGFDEKIKAAQIAAKEEIKDKIITQAKEKMRVARENITKEKEAAIQTIAQERDQLQQRLNQVEQQLTEAQQQVAQARQELTQVRQELEATKAARDEALASASNSAANANTGNNADTNTSAGATQDVTMDEEGQIHESTGGHSDEEVQALQARITAAENRANEESNRSVTLHIQLQGAQERVQTLENQAGELQQRIASLNEELSEAQARASQVEARVKELEANGSGDGQSVDANNTGSFSEDIEKLKAELSAAQKEIEDLRTRTEMVDSVAATNTDENSQQVVEQDAQQFASLKASLDEREAGLSTREAEIAKREAEQEERRGLLDQREAENEGKMGRLRSKFNDSIKKKNEQIEQLKTDHQAEIERIRQEAANTTVPTQPSVTEAEAPKEEAAPPTTATSDPVVKVEGIPGAEASDDEIKKFLDVNPVAKQILRSNLKRVVDSQKKNWEESSSKNMQDALIKVKEEHDGEIKAKLEAEREKVRKEADMRNAVKLNMARNYQAKWAVIEKAAKETPTEEVAKVYEVAKSAKAPPAQPPATAPAKAPPPPQQAQSSNPAQSIPTAPPAAQQDGAVAVGPQANGANVNEFSQSTGQQPVGQMQPNPFQQAGHAMVQNQMGRGVGGFTGITPPGFTGQGPMQNNQRPNSPFGQQPHQLQQPGGRGQPNVGTGPAALQNIVRQQAQSGIPRGGASGIPLPGGRGRGTGQQQQGQAQIPPVNTQGTGASQIGRGGGRGGGRGRGQGQGPASPRTLNPGAQNFQPGGAGRGQKRGAEDEGEGGTRGGKRPRGRGGQQGAAGAGAGAGGAPAAE